MKREKRNEIRNRVYVCRVLNGGAMSDVERDRDDLMDEVDMLLGELRRRGEAV